MKLIDWESNSGKPFAVVTTLVDTTDGDETEIAAIHGGLMPLPAPHDVIELNGRAWVYKSSQTMIDTFRRSVLLRVIMYEAKWQRQKRIAE